MAKPSGTFTYLYLSISLKGGTGKSLFSSVLLDYLRGSGYRVAAYDADGVVGSLSSSNAQKNEAGHIVEHQDPLTGVVGYNIRDESRDMLIESARQQCEFILHDLAGGALIDMMRISDDQDSLRKLFDTFVSLNIIPVFAHLVTPDKETLKSLKTHLDLVDDLGDVGKRARHIVVLNLRGALTKEDFPFWYGFTDPDGVAMGGKIRTRFLASGGVEMVLPNIKERTLSLAKALGIPLSEATRDRRLKIADQQRVSHFLKDFSAAMSTDVRNLMGLNNDA